MNNNHFDIIVVGTGTMGSAACYYLAKSGKRVLGLEQFSGPNEKASHAGQTRIIRKAYFEHPDYVPLLERAYTNWKAFEETSDAKLYFETGLLYAGKPDNDVIKGVKESARLYNIPLHHLTSSELHGRYPAFSIPAEYEILLEPEAGFLLPEQAITLYIKESVRLGATMMSKTAVTGWSDEKDRIEVHTATDTYTCDKLIITAGAWTSKLVPSLGANLKVTRQVLGWFEPANPKLFAHGSLPCWLIAEENNQGAYYGFPSLPGNEFDGPNGSKIAHHYPATEVDPDQVDRVISERDRNSLVSMAQSIFAGQFKSLNEVKVCLYTNTADENFVIDFLPGQNNVIVAAGFSGHGFKFASVIGEILQDLAINGKTDLPIKFLGIDRLT